MRNRTIAALVLALSLTAAAGADVSAPQLGAFLDIGCTVSYGNICYGFRIMDADGTHVIAPPDPGYRPRWSRDGRSLIGARDGEIFVTPVTGGSNAVNLTNHPALDDTPEWSPDGSKIAFASDRDGSLDLYLMNGDGTGVEHLTTGVARAWAPAWSPDGSRLAFNCSDSSSGPADICAIDVDGSAFVRLTTDPGGDYDPSWSPDGQTIAFSTDRFNAVGEIVTIHPDGSGFTRLLPEIYGMAPQWSADGTQIAFDSIDFDSGGWEPPRMVMVMNADGSNAMLVAMGYAPIWRPASGIGTNDRPVASFTATCIDATCTLDGTASTDSDGTIAEYGWQLNDGTLSNAPTFTHTFVAGHQYTANLIVMDNQGALATVLQLIDVDQPPVASFTFSCSGLTCTFDGSSSSDPDGTIQYYSWEFGDVRGGSGQTASHTYAAAGIYTVGLKVWDAAGKTDTFSATVVVNTPPVASFTSNCTALQCAFDASASSDGDGSIAAYAWNFGDGGSETGRTTAHAYAAAGSYAVTLTVTDNLGGSSTATLTVVVTQPEVHVGDLDATAQRQSNSWTATIAITVHNAAHGTVADTTVSGSWSTGASGTCVTNASGRCSITSGAIPNKTATATFTVAGVSTPGSVYRAASNHDPDGDSNGSSIAARRP